MEYWRGIVQGDTGGGVVLWDTGGGLVLGDTGGGLVIWDTGGRSCARGYWRGVVL